MVCSQNAKARLIFAFTSGHQRSSRPDKTTSSRRILDEAVSFRQLEQIKLKCNRTVEWRGDLCVVSLRAKRTTRRSSLHC
jgi:hypothetical protein